MERAGNIIYRYDYKFSKIKYPCFSSNMFMFINLVSYRKAKIDLFSGQLFFHFVQASYAGGGAEAGGCCSGILLFGLLEVVVVVNCC